MSDEEMSDTDSFKTELKSLYCSICQNIFCEPKSLPCQHSFCCPCLKTYLNTKAQNLRDGQKLREFSCPLCKTAVRSEDDSLSVGEWVDRFPTNFTLISITDEFISEKHRKERRTMCTIHPSKSVKFFCMDCNTLLCSLCTAKAHKTCSTVQTLAEAVDEIMSTKARLCNQLQTRKTEVEEVYTRLNKHRSAMNVNKQQIIRDIQNETELIAKLLHELRDREKEVVIDLENQYSEGQLRLREILTKYESIIKSINICQNLIEHNALEDVGDAAFLKAISGAEQKYKELPEIDTSAPNRHVLMFQPDPSLQQRLQRLVKRPLGKIFIHQQQQQKQQQQPNFDSCDHMSDGSASVAPTETGSSLAEAIDDTITSTVLLSKFSTIFSSDDSLITDVALLPDGFLVVTDSLSCQVKIFTEEGELVKYIKLENSPWGICRLIQGEIGVTVPSKKNIVYLSHAAQFCIRWTAMTSKRYLGIVSLSESVLVCASASNSCVDIISITGEIYQSFGKKIVHPTYIALTKEHHIVITDSYEKSVICLDRQGNELFRYFGHKDQALSHPAGVCTSRQGGIFVADALNRNIYKIRHIPLFANITQFTLSGLAISPDNKLVLTHNGQNNVSGISVFHD